MRHKLVLMGLMILFTNAIKHHHDMSSQTQSQQSQDIEILGQSELGQMFVDFAQVELETSGAVDVLNEVMKAFGRQLEDRLNQEEIMFDARQGDHTSKSIQLESLVTQAQLDVNREKKTLNNELIPRSEELDEILVSLKSNKDKTKDSINQAQMTRKEQTITFNAQANEASEAIRVVDQSLEQIKGMMTGDSLLQIQSSDQNLIKQSIHNIKIRAEKIGKSLVLGSFLEALSQLSEGQNFGDRQVIKQLVDLLNSLRQGFLETLQKLYNDEDQQKLLHEQRLTQLQRESDVFNKQYGEAYQEREEKSIRISDTNYGIQTRQEDLANYQDRLTIENNSYSMNQQIHDDLTASLNAQIGVIEKSMDLMSSPSMIDSLQSAMNKAV